MSARSFACRAVPALLAFLWVTPAAAYVRTLTSHGVPIAWRQGGPAPNLDGPGEAWTHRDTFVLAAEHWNDPTQACDNPKIQVQPGTVTGLDVALDGTDVVVWRPEGYCKDESHAEDTLCVDSGIDASTTVFFVDKPGDPHDGDILEADLALNDSDGRFTNNWVDLNETVTHEFGHMLGLNHSCSFDTVLYDNTGAPAPSCDATDVPPAVVQATMFAYHSPDTVARRTPTAEEVAGVCAIYKGNGGGTGVGCQVGFSHPASSDRGGLGILVTVLALAGLKRRKGY